MRSDRVFADSAELPRYSKAGYVYVVAKGSAGPVKIGIASNPRRRIRGLEAQAGCRFDAIWVSAPVDRASTIEAGAHRQLKAARTIGEWFNVQLEEAIAVVQDQVRAVPRVRVEASIPPSKMTAAQAEAAMDRATRAALPLLAAFLESERRPVTKRRGG